MILAVVFWHSSFWQNMQVVPIVVLDLGNDLVARDMLSDNYT